MKILVIGATGPTGQEIVKQGLAQGHQLTALVRNQEKFETRHASLKVICGDVLNSKDMTLAMEGQEVVLCSLGMGVTFQHVTLFSDGTRNILAAMQHQGVSRVLCITGIGAGDSRGHGGFVYDRIVEPILLRQIYEDKDRQEQLIRQSDRDWIIVRPGMLTNDPGTGHYRVLLDLTGVTVGKIARADVAAFLLANLQSDQYLHKTPVLTT